MSLMQILVETQGSLLSPVSSGAEEIVSTLVLWLILLIEVTAAILIGVGVALTLAKLGKFLLLRKGEGYEKTRLTLARFLALALEFQLAADVLGTAFSPSWAQIGKLGAIAVIRTALNYFLAKEIEEEENRTSEGLDHKGLETEA